MIYQGNVVTLYYSQSEEFSADVAEATLPAPVEGMSIRYADIASFADKNVFFARGHIPAGATVPCHAAASHYAFFVLGGTGQLTLHLADGKETNRIEYKPGDLIFFPPNSHHSWVNEGEPLDWFGVDIA